MGLGPRPLTAGTPLVGFQRDAFAVAGAGNAYLLGSTYTADFPTTPGAYRTPRPAAFDGFVAKFRPDGSGLVWSTYVGGSGIGGVSSIALDAAGNACAADTPSISRLLRAPSSRARHPTCPCFQQRLCRRRHRRSRLSNGPRRRPALRRQRVRLRHAFLTKFDADARAILYSTYLGGSVRDDGASIALDRNVNAYVIGRSDSTNFGGTPGTLSAPTGQVFLSKIDFATPAPSPAVNCVPNLASRAAGAFAPDELVGIFGTDFGLAEAVPLHIESARLATSLGGTRVLFDGVPAPLLMVSANQVNAIGPYAVTSRTATEMQVEVGGRLLPSRRFPVRQFAPASSRRTVSAVGAPPLSSTRTAR